jgi:hypothetical protein
MDKVPMPFYALHFDYSDSFIRPKNRNTQILTIVDRFAKFCIRYPVRSTKTKYTIKALDQILALFKISIRMITDRASAFTSHLT